MSQQTCSENTRRLTASYRISLLVVPAELRLRASLSLPRWSG